MIHCASRRTRGLTSDLGGRNVAAPHAAVTATAPRGSGAVTSGPGHTDHAPRRAAIAARTLRTDRWWLQPLLTVVALVLFIIYSTFRAFQNAHYFAEPYISPFYSPCITTACEGDTFPKLFTGPSWISPAIYILIFPLGIRLTCYYYRKAYYRAFWMSPPACAVPDGHQKYTGETRFPLIGQNLHRYAFYAAGIISVINTWDAVIAFQSPSGFGFGLGNIILVVNVVMHGE